MNSDTVKRINSLELQLRAVMLLQITPIQLLMKGNLKIYRNVTKATRN
jgi:hypothetical protein